MESAVTPPPKGIGDYKFEHHKPQTITSGRKQTLPRIPIRHTRTITGPK